MQQLMKATRHQRIQQGEFVRVVVVESGAVDGSLFRNILHRNLVEALCTHKRSQGSLEELAGTANPRIANLAVRNRHVHTY